MEKPLAVLQNKKERISAQGAKKTATFVKLCDAFGVGILTITDTAGFVADLEQERELAQAVGAMTGAFVQASVPKCQCHHKEGIWKCLCIYEQ